MKLRFAFLLTVLALLTACAALADGGWSCGGCGRWIPAALGLRCPYCGTLHEHRWLSATCTEPERCVCGETRGAPLGHDWHEAGCTSPRACARCGLTEGAPAGHAWDEGAVSLAPTCTAPGLLLYTCRVCGEMRQESLPPDPDRHAGGQELRDQRPASCLEDGYTGDAYCAACGQLVARGVALPAAGHQWRDATCQAPRTCAACGLTEGGTAEHHWDGGQTLSPATCVGEGAVCYTCTVCGETRTDVLPPDPLRHMGDTEIRDRRAPGCEATGYTGDTYCLDCGGLISSGSALSARGHRWQAADCTRPKTCAVCGKTEGEAVGHLWSVTLLEPSTCAWPGRQRSQCVVCGQTEEDELPLDPARHTGKTDIRGKIEAACEADGYTGDTYCADCGQLLKTGSVTPARGHDWLAATADAPKTCRICGRTEGEPLPAVARETCFLGRYEQDQDTAGGPEPIEWLVLERRGSQALLVSLYGLDVQPYYNDWVETTWEKCTLRTWLQTSFLKTAFSERERQAILTTAVSAEEGYSGWSTEGGGSTRDRVFLLSDREAFSLFASDAERACSATPYARAQGAKTDAEGRCWWWLRSPGMQQDNAAYIGFDGSRRSHYVLNTSICVRPAMWVDLSALP